MKVHVFGHLISSVNSGHRAVTDRLVLRKFQQCLCSTFRHPPTHTWRRSIARKQGVRRFQQTSPGRSSGGTAQDDSLSAQAGPSPWDGPAGPHLRATVAGPARRAARLTDPTMLHCRMRFNQRTKFYHRSAICADNRAAI